VRRLNLEHLVRYELDPVASAPGVVDLFIFGFRSFFFLDRMELLDHPRSHEDLFSFPLYYMSFFLFLVLGFEAQSVAVIILFLCALGDGAERGGVGSAWPWGRIERAAGLPS
jgi:dolichol kinase